MKTGWLAGLLAVWISSATACPAIGREVTFTSPPKAEPAGGGARISFAVSGPTDFEVAILDTDVRVVRHLAAGTLGAKDAGAGDTQGAIAHRLAWDGRDDAGKPADGGPFRARVALGLTPRLHRVIGWSGQDVSANRGLACGPDGTLYVVYGGALYAHRQTTLITAFDAGGKHLRQVFPGPAGLPPQKRAGWPHVRLEDGRDVPVIGHLLSRAVYPGAVFANRNFPVVTRDGRLILLGGSGRGTTIKHADVRGGRRLLILGTDGSVPADYLGPVVAPPEMDGFGHLALSPDEKTVYVAGLFEGGKKGRGLCNVVWRMPLDGSNKPEVFLGKLYAKGGGEGGLNDPQGLATDAAGNLYVADYGNGRIAVFGLEGRLLEEIPVENPDQVRVHRRTGAVYVMALRERAKGIDDQHYFVAAHNWAGARVVKFASPKDKKPAAAFDLPQSRFGGGAFLALDDSSEVPALWVAGLEYSHRGRIKLLDRGDRFEPLGDPIGGRLKAGKVPPLGFFGDVAASGGKVIARHPAFGGSMSSASYVYDAATGRPSGTYVPKTPEGRPENVWNLLYGEMVAGKDGNFYAYAGKELRRFDAEGRALPFAASKTYFLDGIFHGHTRAAGLFVDRRGRIYIPAAAGNRKLERMNVRVIAPDGKVVEQNALEVQDARVGGIAADRAGNIYLGVQLAPKGRRVPSWAEGKLPPDGPEHHPSIDYQQCGAIVKFPPTGGAILRDPDGPYEVHLAWKKGGPARVENALWMRRLGHQPVSDEIGCYCETTRFDIDEFGRLFVPDLYRFCVYVLDGDGRTITTIGSYGNMDSRGPGSPVPAPEIAFGWPLSVECAGGRIYVADLVNRRVVAVRFEHAVEAFCNVRGR